MKRLLSLFSLLLALVLLPTLGTNQAQPVTAQADRDTTQPNSATTSLADVSNALQSSPVMFIENVGQFDEDARFHVRGGDYDLWLASDALWVTLLEAPDKEPLREPFDPTKRFGEPTEDKPRKGVNLKLSFVDANPQPEIEPFDLLDTKTNYFLGNDSDKWRSNVPVYGGVRYKDIYPGIDLELTSENGHSVQRFVATEEADLDTVRLRVEGADEMELLTKRTSGETMGLTVKTAIGDVTLPLFSIKAPDGTPLESPRAPTLNANHIQAPFAPDIQEPLSHVPDSTLAYSTFIGGSDGDQGYSLALGSTGNTVVTGLTRSSDFPTMAGSYDTTYNIGNDIFVLQLNEAGNALIYSTFIGGSSSDTSHELALDNAGNAVVTGYTLSSDFPTTQGSYQPTYNGNGETFVFKLNSVGDALIYSTFIGGSSTDSGYSLAVDSTGNAVVTGTTYSDDFPTTPGSYDTTLNGLNDAFVLQLNSAGDTLLYSTFIGGDGSDEDRALALDSAGNIVVMGRTGSSDFPTTGGSYDTTHNGGSDIFVFKLNAAGDTLIYSTFIGTWNHDDGQSLVLDSADNAIVMGSTGNSSFPTTGGSYDTTHNGSGDVFVLQLSSAGDALLYSTFIGGSDNETGQSLALDSAGNAVVTGSTNSSDFPTTAGSYDTTHNGSNDTFVLLLSSAGDALLYSTFIGGSSVDVGFGLALDSAGNAVLTGYTSSSDFPTTAGSYDTAYNGGFHDTFVLRFDGLGSGEPTYSISGQVTNDNSEPLPDITIQLNDEGGEHSTTTTDSNGNYTFSDLPAGGYIFAPIGSSYTFEPSSRFVEVPPDATGQDFVGTVGTVVPFRPDVDGYHFNNFGIGPIEPLATFDVFTETFDLNYKTNWDILALIYYSDVYSKLGSSGLCSGMATSSMLLYKGEDWVDPVDFLAQQDVKTTFELSKNSQVVKDFILRYHGYQKGKQIRNAKNHYNLSFSEMVDDITDSIDDRLSNPVYIAIRGESSDANKSAGHAVMPYAYDQEGNVLEVYVYDPNRPGSNDRKMTFHLDTEDWEYPRGDGRIWGSNQDDSFHDIKALPLSLWKDKPILEWGKVETNSSSNRLDSSARGEEAFHTIVINGNAKAFLTDDQGRSLGYLPSGEFVDQIPNANQVIPDSDIPGIELTYPEEYDIGANTIFTTTIVYTDINQPALLTDFVNEGVIQVEGISTLPNTVDRIRVVPERHVATVKAGSSADGRSIAVIKQQGEFGIEAKINGFALDAENEASFELDVANNTNVTKFKSSTADDNYSINMNQSSVEGTIGFTSTNLQIEAGDTHIVTLDWDNVETATLEIDNGSDGTIDETMTLDNETPDNQLFLPLVIR